MAKKEIEIGQQCAFIRDNALVLYFDKAETPFVARYDLDSLAQANFEVTDKKDGLFTLALRDYSGRSQDIGQFPNRADAHQALFTILQALLEHKDSTEKTERKMRGVCGIGCMLLRVLKWVLLIIGALVALYIILGLVPASLFSGGNQVNNVVQAPVQKTMTGKNTMADLSTLPEGQAVDADALFSGAMMKDNAQDVQQGSTKAVQDDAMDGIDTDSGDSK